MNDEPVIEITNLVKEYKMFNRKKDRLLEAIIPKYQRHQTFKAMDNLNLKIKKGEVLGILGKNGAGKSTLLKMITGVVFPTSGEIKINGKISSLLELGTAFNPELTGIENIYQHGEVMGLSHEQIEEKKDEIISFADIGDHIYQPVKTYSSGMFARLAFACAINVDPDILIVDEVLSVGDMAFQLKCFKKFEQFKESGKTILFVTHSIADVMRNCTRAIILDEGKKIFDGSVKDGVDKYKKLIVGLEIDNEIKVEDVEQNDSSESMLTEAVKDEEIWKDNFELNPEELIYGTKAVDIIDYGIFNKDGKYETLIKNSEEVTVKMKVKFNKKIVNPIFALTIKDIKGVEFCGTNTIIDRLETGTYEKGDIAVVSFKQIIPIMPGKYTLSFGCVKYNNNGELEVFQRRYDTIFIEIMSYRECIALCDLNSKIMFEKLKGAKNVDKNKEK